MVMANAASAADAAAAAASDQGSTAVEDVIVKAPRQEDKALARQLQAPNIINVQSAETIEKYPDFNAAESLGRIPGVSLSSDTGEGRFVNIRGIDANLNGATYGGVVLLNTNPGGTAAGGGGRAVEFDTVPTGAIDGIVVTKTRLPDQEGEGLGGTVELTPRSAANLTKPFMEGTLGWGFEPLHDHTGPFEISVAAGARFGFNNGHLVVAGDGQEPAAGSGWISNPTPFSFVLNYSRKDDRRGIDDLEESYTDASVPPTSKQAHQYDFRRYDYHRRRFAYGGEFDFEPNDDHAYYVRASQAGYVEAVHKNFLLLRNLDGGVNAPDPVTGVVGPSGNVLVDPNDPKGFISTTTVNITTTDEEETHRNEVYVIGGRDRFNDISIDYRVAFSRASFSVGHNYTSRFSSADGIPIAYDNVSNNEFPSFTYVTDAFHPTVFNPNDPNQYTLSSINNSREQDVDEEISYAGNASFPLHLINNSDHVKTGFEIRLRDKVVDPIFYNFANPTPAISLATISGPANSYYENHYTNGPFIDIYGIRKLYNTLGPSFQTDDTGFFKARENIYAGYGEYFTDIGPLSFLVGVRVEGTQAHYSSNTGSTVFDANGNPVTTFTPNSHTENYVNAFPTVQVKYTVTPDLAVRAIYSTGIARPGFEQNKATSSVDVTTNPGTVIIVRGNPALRPTTGDSFDLSLEYRVPHGGILEVGVFDKEFSDYIVPFSNRGVTDPVDEALVPPGFAGQTIVLTTFQNIKSAYARGFEAAYRQKFNWLIRPLDGLGVDGNITIVDSRIREYDASTAAARVNEYGLLPGTSHVTWNAALFYEAYGADLRLSAEYVGPSLFALGGDKSLDTIQDKRLTMDFTSAYEISKNIKVYFNAKNLLNTPLRYYEGASYRPIQREFYDATLEGGVKVKF
jgi:TonB-dependent receptor